MEPTIIEKRASEATREKIRATILEVSQRTEDNSSLCWEDEIEIALFKTLGLVEES